MHLKAIARLYGDHGEEILGENCVAVTTRSCEHMNRTVNAMCKSYIFWLIVSEVCGVICSIFATELLHRNPAGAVPIILKRLRQKDLEWRKARQQLNQQVRRIRYLLT